MEMEDVQEEWECQRAGQSSAQPQAISRNTFSNAIIRSAVSGRAPQTVANIEYRTAARRVTPSPKTTTQMDHFPPRTTSPSEAFNID